MLSKLPVKKMMKYLTEGLAVAVAAFVIPRKTMRPMEVLMLALTAAATFALLDNLSPLLASGARVGAGVQIGVNMVGGCGCHCGCDKCDKKPVAEEEASEEGVVVKAVDARAEAEAEVVAAIGEGPSGVEEGFFGQWQQGQQGQQVGSGCGCGMSLSA